MSSAYIEQIHACWRGFELFPLILAILQLISVILSLRADCVWGLLPFFFIRQS